MRLTKMVGKKVIHADPSLVTMIHTCKTMAELEKMRKLEARMTSMGTKTKKRVAAAFAAMEKKLAAVPPPPPAPEAAPEPAPAPAVEEGKPS